MVQGYFQGRIIGRRSKLYILNRDFESKKHSYFIKSYLEVLDNQIPKCQQPSLIFIQDNASIHTARAVKHQFYDIGISLFDQPLYSLDLNPIEQVQVHLKRKVVELHLELEFATRKSEVDLEALEKALIEAQNVLLTSLFELQFVVC